MAWRGGFVFLAVYLAVIGLIALFVFTLGNHMSGLLFGIPALPWPLLGRWLFGPRGLEAGFWGGLVLNGFIVFGLGMAAFRSRKERPS